MTDAFTTPENTLEQLEKSPGYPSKQRLEKGPVAVIECTQNIPCDVCGSICPTNAIEVPSVSALPRLYEERCTGCGLCIPVCPSLAIFQVDYPYTQGDVAISFPYELRPLPQVNARIEATDRLGRRVTKGRVVKITMQDSFDKTAVITITIPKKFGGIVRGMIVPKEGRD